MKRILLFLLVPFTAIAADTPVAIVRGTNVLGTAIIEPSRFTPPAGASNVVVEPVLVSIVGKGWRYVGGNFLDPSGNPLVLSTAKSRTRRLDQLIVEYQTTLADFATIRSNWATITNLSQIRTVVGKAGAAVEANTELLLLLIKERRAELLELKEVE